ncbi:3-keto-disaccharide hydrolase [Aquirufa sp. HETE-40SA]
MKTYCHRCIWLFVSLLAIQAPCFGQIKQLEKGFKAIFNGKSLQGWEGDPTYWRVEDGRIIGEITPQTLLKRNTFLIYRGSQPADFELKAEFKISKGGNTGINYRSEELLPDLPLALKGYQADIDGDIRYTGQNYEERGRTTLAYRGEIVSVNEQTDAAMKTNLRAFSKNNAWLPRTVTGSLGNIDSLKTAIKSEDWNEVHLVIKGNRLQHFVNGVLMSDVTDLDQVNGKASGWLGVQVHVGPPMKVEFKNIRIKNLK